jgi:hypothetical protein
MNNAGTLELAAVNISGGNQLDETNLISTTAEGGAGGADSSSVIYSATARTNLAYRVLGYVESTQATAGTWATTPSTIQGAGGQALTALSSIGYGQSEQDVSASRAVATTYYNTTGKPIEVKVSLQGTGGAGQALQVNMDGLTFYGSAASGSGAVCSAAFIVKSGSSYLVTLTPTTGAAITKWIELR